MKKPTIFVIVILLIGLCLFGGDANAGNPFKKKQHEPSGVNATTRPAVQDTFCGATFGSSYSTTLSKIKKKYKSGIMPFGVKYGVSLDMFDFGGFVWSNTVFYTKPKIGFYRIIMSHDCSTTKDAETLFIYFRDLIKEKYGEHVMVTEEDSVFYKDLNGRSVLLSKKGFSLGLTYSDDILSDIEHARVLNEM